MLPLDTKAPNAAGSSSSSSLPIPGGYNRLPLNPGIKPFMHVVALAFVGV